MQARLGCEPFFFRAATMSNSSHRDNDDSVRPAQRARVDNSGGNNDNNGGDDRDFRSMPAFTAEEEKRDIESLSFAELARVQSDLVGLTSLLESLQPPSSEQTRIDDAAITGLEAQVRRLPRSDTEAYYAAAARCPDQLTHKRKMLFLKANQNDLAGAAANLAEYWKIRVEVFGDGRAYLPMTLAGAMKDEKINLTSRCVWQLLPRADTAGRPMLFFCPGRRNFAEYTVDQEMAALWYFLETIVEDENLRKHGLVILADLRNFSWNQMSRKAIRLLTQMVTTMPLSLKGGHLCYPSTLANYIISIAKRLFPKAIRLRSRMHYGTPSQVLTELSGFCLPMDRIPVDLGGLLPVNALEWVMKRQILEMLRDGSISPASAGVALGNIQSQRGNISQATAGARTNLLAPALAAMLQQINPRVSQQIAPPPQQQTSHQMHRDPSAVEDAQAKASVAESSIPNGAHFQSHSDSQLYECIARARQTNSTGRRSDPRMHRALMMTVQDENLSRLDALLAAGFVFPGKTLSEIKASNARTLKDSEGVTLKQRRDQLNRRLREVKGWIQHARLTGDLSGT